MKYFITGATGFLGGEIAQQLERAGHEVIALVRTPSKAGALRDLGVTLAEGDITDKESMRAPMTGVDGVFHAAAWYKVGVRDTSLAHAINVGGTRNVLELMKELGTPRGVYTSTLAVFSDTRGQKPDESYRFEGKHMSKYDETKARAHYEVAEPMIREGLPLIIIQPGVIYGPGDISTMGGARLMYLKGQLPLVPAQTAFCWTHVADSARGHILAMEKGVPGETYILAGPCHTFTEMMDMAEEMTGIRAPRLRPGPGMMKAMAAFMGAVGAIIPLPESYASESLRTSAGTTYFGNDAKARRELGWDARPLREGMHETLSAEMKLAGVKPKKDM
jgi:nucleoside-diphosphate-sugar epimerase